MTQGSAPAREHSPTFFDQRVEIPDRVTESLVAIHPREVIGAAGIHARKVQQIVDQLLHAFRAFDDEVDELVRVAGELPLVTLGEKLRVD